MGYIGTHRIDDLGRIIVPKVFRNKYGWQTGDNIALWDKGGMIILRPEPTYKPQRCTLCGKPEVKTILEYAEICIKCMHEVDMGFN